MERWKCKVALVTGASSGIGRTIAKGLVRNGLKVIAIARRSDLLQELAEEFHLNDNAQIKCMKCDVTNVDDIKHVIRFVEVEWKTTISVLVNCAGVLIMNPISGGKHEAVTNVFNTNVIGMTNCIREVVQSMKKFNIEEGHVFNINSVCGHHILVSPTMGLHNASKFAVTALSESLKNELALQKLPIRVTSISPGFVQTEMTNLIKDAEKMPKLQTEDILNCIVFALSSPKHVNISELTVQPLGELLNTF